MPPRSSKSGSLDQLDGGDAQSTHEVFCTLSIETEENFVFFRGNFA